MELSFGDVFWETLPAVLYLTVLAALLIGVRRPIVYWLGIGALAWHCWQVLWRLAYLTYLRQAYTDQEMEETLLGMACAIPLALWLLCRITFGRPSRRYFRIFIRES